MKSANPSAGWAAAFQALSDARQTLHKVGLCSCGALLGSSVCLTAAARPQTIVVRDLTINMDRDHSRDPLVPGATRKVFHGYEVGGQRMGPGSELCLTSSSPGSCLCWEEPTSPRGCGYVLTRLPPLQQTRAYWSYLVTEGHPKSK